MENVAIDLIGDVPFVNNGQGEKVFRIPVEWKVYDIVEVRANSLEEAIQLFLDNDQNIPLGTAPEYAEDSYQISCDSGRNYDAKVIAQELEDNYGNFSAYMSSDYDDLDVY